MCYNSGYYGVCFDINDKNIYEKYLKILEGINKIFAGVDKFDIDENPFHFHDKYIIYKLNKKPFYWEDIFECIKKLEKITKIKNIMIYRQSLDTIEIYMKGCRGYIF